MATVARLVRVRPERLNAASEATFGPTPKLSDEILVGPSPAPAGARARAVQGPIARIVTKRERQPVAKTSTSRAETSFARRATSPAAALLSTSEQAGDNTPHSPERLVARKLDRNASFHLQVLRMTRLKL
jgi:hypothetical protein